MRIYLLRHGIAEDAGPKLPDAKRELTDEGRKKLQNVLRAAARARVRPELVLSSPLVRAIQTAEMVREILDVESPVQLTPLLVPEGHPHKVWEELRGLRNFGEILLAGHQPMLGELTAYLLGSPDLQVHMTKAALLSIEIENTRGEPRGILNWMLTPKIAD